MELKIHLQHSRLLPWDIGSSTKPEAAAENLEGLLLPSTPLRSAGQVLELVREQQGKLFGILNSLCGFLPIVDGHPPAKPTKVPLDGPSHSVKKDKSLGLLPA